jgi:hypothetical protein
MEGKEPLSTPLLDGRNGNGYAENLQNKSFMPLYQ